MGFLAKLAARIIARLIGAALTFVGVSAFLVLKDVYQNHLALVLIGTACLVCGAYLIRRSFK